MKLLKSIAAFALTFIFFYLIMSFTKASFNPFYWNEVERFIVAWFGGAIGVLNGIFINRLSD